ncbi:MAG: GNAT family N-acetyltransferase [Caulobacteraceae bacterium]
MTVTVRRLKPDDDRTSFRSGNIDLDRFFARYAGQNQFRHHIGATWVAVDERGAILGFATIAASELTTATLSAAMRRRLPAYPLPVLRLARLAVDERARGKGVAQALLRAVFALAHAVAAELGCIGVVVDAKAEAVEFYRRLGFIELEARAGHLGDRPQPLPMYLELAAIPAPPRD